MKKAKKSDDFTGSKKAHDEAAGRVLNSGKSLGSRFRPREQEEVILLKSVFSRIRRFPNQFIGVKYTSIPYWRPWRGFSSIANRSTCLSAKSFRVPDPLALPHCSSCRLHIILLDWPPAAELTSVGPPPVSREREPATWLIQVQRKLYGSSLSKNLVCARSHMI